MTAQKLSDYAFEAVGIRPDSNPAPGSHPLFVSDRGRDLYDLLFEVSTFNDHFGGFPRELEHFKRCEAAMQMALEEGSPWADPVSTSNVARNRMLNEMRSLRIAMMTEVNGAGFLQEHALNKMKADVTAYLSGNLVAISAVAPFDKIKSGDSRDVMHDIVRDYPGLIDRGSSSVIFESIRNATMGVRVNRFGFLEFYYDLSLPIEYVPAELMNPLPVAADLLAHMESMWSDAMRVFQFSGVRGKYNFI